MPVQTQKEKPANSAASAVRIRARVERPSFTWAKTKPPEQVRLTVLKFTVEMDDATAERLPKVVQELWRRFGPNTDAVNGKKEDFIGFEALEVRYAEPDEEAAVRIEGNIDGLRIYRAKDAVFLAFSVRVRSESLTARLGTEDWGAQVWVSFHGN